MKSNLELKLDKYQSILNKLEYDKNDKEAIDFITNMVKDDIIKISKMCIDTDGDVREKLLGFVLKMDINYINFSEITLNTLSGIMETISDYDGYGRISFGRRINRKACEAIDEIVNEKLGRKRIRRGKLLSIQKDRIVDKKKEDAEILKIDNELYKYRDILNDFAYGVNREKIDELMDKMLKNDVVKKSKVYRKLNGVVKEELLGFILTLKSKYSSIYFDTERERIETMLRTNENHESLLGESIWDFNCEAINDFLSEKFKVKAIKNY